MRSALLSSCLVLASCSSGVADPDSPARSEPEQGAPAPARAAEDTSEAPMRVLVTGFNDWRELGDPPKVWRCRDNPSCRLLLGAETASAPTEHGGPLVRRLREGAPEVEWRFATMPVTWGVFSEVPEDVDLIVNVGLGVYDRFDALQLEIGAYNLGEGADAAGLARSGPIGDDAGEVLAAPSASPIRAKIEGLAGRTIAGYEILAAPARPENSYLCNETHYHALSALHGGPERLREVYFLHIPYARDGDYEALADGVAGVVLGLVAE